MKITNTTREVVVEVPTLISLQNLKRGICSQKMFLESLTPLNKVFYFQRTANDVTKAYIH